MSRASVLAVLLAALGACATTAASVRAPASSCTDACLAASYDREARAACLERCPGATASADPCPPPLTHDEECVAAHDPPEAEEHHQVASFIEITILLLWWK